MQCQAEQGVPNFGSLTLVHVPESGVIELTCGRGHHTYSVVQDAKFEILSDMAIRALVEEDYRGAVSNFVTALERLFEFFTLAMFRKHGVEAAASEKAWKPLARMSERQLGAYVAAHLIETGGQPFLLPDKQVKFRNDVIHNGRLPDRDEAVAFGQAVCDCAVPTLAILGSDSYRHIVTQLTTERIRARRAMAKDSQYPVSTGASATLFHPDGGIEAIDLEQEIAKYAARPDLKEGVQQARVLGALIAESVREAED